MNAAGILENGSVRGFVIGTNYNRCKRIHPILAAAFKLHMKSFFGSCEKWNLTLMKKVMAILDIGENVVIYIPEEVMELLKDYGSYCDKTREGSHGPTAQFWIICRIDMINLYHQLTKAVKIGDQKPFIHLSPSFSAWFFSFNRKNLFLSKNLLNMESTYPGITEFFENVIISLKRRTNLFGRSLKDLTLEQTINNDAAGPEGKLLIRLQ